MELQMQPLLDLVLDFPFIAIFTAAFGLTGGWVGGKGGAIAGCILGFAVGAAAHYYLMSRWNDVTSRRPWLKTATDFVTLIAVLVLAVYLAFSLWSK
jgi:hypothetical protein